MDQNRRNQLYSLQYLRAIAAIGVVLVHASTTLKSHDASPLVFRPGSYGVDLFFVISGFVMFYTTADRPTTPGRFLLRRCVRVVPIYFLLTTFAFALALLAPRMTNLFSAAPLDYLRSILFIPYYNRFFSDIRPEVQQGWTLNYEMFFYVVFACCLWLKERYRVAACMGAFVALAAIGSAVSPRGVLASTYTNPILLEFGFGTLLGYFLVRRRAAFPRFVGVTLVAAAGATVCALWLPAPHRVLFAGVPATAVVGGVILLEERGLLPSWPFLLLIGDASYSLYLIHTFVLATLKRIFVHLVDPTKLKSEFIFMLCGLAAAIFVAILFYRAVEAPINHRLQALTAHKKTPRAEPAGTATVSTQLRGDAPVPGASEWPEEAIVREAVRG